jgi:membrane protein required for colicin V production
MTDILSMNLFDAAIYLCLFIAVVMGFMTGLLRSLATIFGYVAGMGIAMIATPRVIPLLTTYLKMPTPQTWVVVVAIFVTAGAALSALLRFIVSEMVSPDVSIPDRIAGGFLGAFRVGLMAVLIVVIFDRFIPPNREPPFLHGSKWRPALSEIGNHGLQALPPDVEDYLERFKRQQRI